MLKAYVVFIGVRRYICHATLHYSSTVRYYPNFSLVCLFTEMRIPTRTAPRPPVNALAQRSNVWGSTNDIFSTSLMSQPTVQKKKPPPRPPPPKFNQCHNTHSQRDQKSKRPTRPTELLTNFFAWKAAKQEHSNTSRSTSNLSHVQSQSSNTNGTFSLIDLSPPGSPTFTTRSSSDGVSIDSFGSDGNSNPSVFTSSGNTSQTESAFEDDFDFFGMSNKRFTNNDPWQMKPMSDPFGPIEEINRPLEDVRQIGDTSFFAFNDSPTGKKQVPFGQTSSKVIHSVPTIIRPKPPKPPAPKILKKHLDQKTNQRPSTSVERSLSESIPVNSSYSVNDAWADDIKDEPSPPMPTIPPPAPPSEYFVQSKNEFEESSKTPYGIALYDFPVTHSDDLPLKEGDVVTLIRVVNDDWMEGRVGSRQGIFPINFLDIKIPLPGLQDNTVVALYPFKGETPEDLTFEEGAKIKVLSRLSDDWLYGEYKGIKGQFPTNYVNRVPYSISRST
ncbi:abl interactor 1-like isoform X1 [Vespa mandarinia]|uniref:abl interactor 1-like isoform X1 n=2 Tax=Vespa mandarinia TaxID=7446 RepID=UPI0016151841|nr:abl interactor 1-like isoform X1 [Vespa mandarinia]